MGELTWEWTLAGGETISARVDEASGVESIYVGQRLVSRSGQGGKIEGHTIALGAGAPSSRDGAYRAATPQEILAKFDPAFQNFELRANGQLVPPARAPNTPSASKPGGVYGPVGAMRYSHSPDPPAIQRAGMSAGRIVGLVVGLLIGLLVSTAGVRRYIANARSSGADTPGGTITAGTDLVTVHYPAGFKVSEETKSSSRPAGRDDDCKGRTCTIQFSLLKIVSTSRDEGGFVASFKMNGLRIGRDPWRVSNLLHDSFQDFVKVHGSDYVELDRQDATCFGEAGAVVTSSFRNKGEDGTMWTCTFIRDGNAYWVGTFVNKKVAADEPEMRKIVDASEIAPAH